MSGQESFDVTAIIGSSPAVVTAVSMARKAASTDIPVLIVGETGTGKELLARLVHEESGRSGSLVAVDCGALPDELIESLLFGHRRGSFTGAVDNSRGLIAEADYGTLFMDELSSLSLRGQSKLLRVLETGAVRRVGDARSEVVGFRLVSTAQIGVAEMVGQGTFRDDLMQRVAGLVIRLPSLRERAEDIGLLAGHFASAEGLEMADEALALLSEREWPGNVRELKWMVARSALFATDGRIDAAAVDTALQMGPSQLISQVEEKPGIDTMRLRALCETHSGDADEVARAMGIGRSTLYRRLRSAGLSLNSFRRRAASA
jgi:transcriptional regulator with PAS, ATPase and Fis domain